MHKPRREDANMASLQAFTQPSAVEISRPLYVVAQGRAFTNRASLNIQVHRMDGAPKTDRFGERYRTDSENWLTRQQVLQLLSSLIDTLPQLSASPIVEDDPETMANLRRFNDEFSYEVAPASRKIG